MTASAYLGDVLSVPFERSVFHVAELSVGTPTKCSERNRSAQIKQVLRRARLTMAQVSTATRMHYGKETPYFVPATFLYKQKKGITAHICQIVALSEVTGCRFADWMELCGFDVKLILPLQLKIHTERTAIVTPDHTLTPWDSPPTARNPKFQQTKRRYLFARIGSRDAVVYPRLIPGSIIRADRYYSPHALESTSASNSLWLVEHSGGVTCCYVKRVDNEHIVLLPNCPPLSGWPLRLSTEARILGLVDLELRPQQSVKFEPMCRPTECDPPPMAPCHTGKISFSNLLRVSRSRSGLTLRATHEMTSIVARLLGTPDYGIALGQLSDYEATDKLPRHVAKIISLCIVYGIDLRELLEAGGVSIDDSDKAALFSHDRGGPFITQHIRASLSSR